MRSILIIGAGPAGSTAAILLARAGIDVTLIEQHRFPRDKVCGECLSATGIDVLERLGLTPLLLRHGPARLGRAILYDTQGASAELTLPREMWGISRRVLDAFLLDEARRSGAQIRQPARVERDTGFSARARCAALQVRDLESNQVESLSADYILTADGKSPETTVDLGLKGHFTHASAPPDAIELFGLQGHYGGIAPIERGLWNIAFSVPTSLVREHRGDLDVLFAEIVSENIALSSQLRRAVCVSGWLVSSLPRFSVQREWPRGTIPIGNSAAAIEPIGGEGMGLAMRSAELAANVLIDAFQNGTEPDLARLRREYRQLWRMRSFGCRAAALAVSSPWLCRMLMPFLATDEPLTALALRALGKS